MKPGLLQTKDFWAGLMLVATGVAAIVIARDYPFGSTLRMGPGYFPTILGAILALFGAYFAIRALRNQEAIQRNWSPRALVLLPLSLVLFGLLMEHAGFLPALVALIFGSAAAGTEFKFIEIVILATVLAA